jgi:uncharacterized protein (DUF1810 family)
MGTSSGERVTDEWRLERFVAAQDRDGTYQHAVAELRAGTKTSHWMWFIFPQIAGLGMSAISREYAISSAGEARAYLVHPVLGPRLRQCAQIVADTEGRSADRIFGPVDALKLRSSMTLFAAAADQADASGDAGASAKDGALFRAILTKYFGGMPDEATVARLLHRNELPGRRPFTMLAPCRGLRPRSPVNSCRTSPASARCSRPGSTSTGRRCWPSARG